MLRVFIGIFVFPVAIDRSFGDGWNPSMCQDLPRRKLSPQISICSESLKRHELLILQSMSVWPSMVSLQKL